MEKKDQIQVCNYKWECFVYNMKIKTLLTGTGNFKSSMLLSVFLQAQ